MSRMGLVSYVKVLAYIKAKLASHKEVAAEFGRYEARMREVLMRMCQLGMAHVTEWERKPQHRGMYVPVFAYGKADSAPHPIESKRLRRAVCSRQMRPELIGLATVMECLQEGETLRGMAETTCMSPSCLGTLIKAMKAHRLVRVVAWEPAKNDNGPPAQVIGLGQGPDAPRPKRQTRTEIVTTYRTRRRAKREMLKMIGHTAGAANESPMENVA